MAQVFSFILLFSITAKATGVDSIQQIHTLMTTLHEQAEFNGSILVAMDGRVAYSNGFGMANFATGEKFTPRTSTNIASVTKQFTAIGIMMLAEQKKLRYDDPISEYIKNLPSCYDSVTIRHLLNQTSGISDYESLGSGSPEKLIRKKKSLRFAPGLMFEYSNSNYMLLSRIIETVSGVPFHDFLKQKIFDPLQMTHTYAHPKQQTGIPADSYSQFGKRNNDVPATALGDGGIYSTTEDLFKWDQALYTDKLVSQSTLSEAFAPGKVRTGKTTYGFGWNISEDNHGKYVWHTGNTSGFRAYIQRRLTEKITIIILTNTGNSRRIEIAEAIHKILHNEPYAVPKKSAAKKMFALINSLGIDRAMLFYDSLKKHSVTADYDFSETEFNLLGYELLGDNKIAEAITIFKLNTIAYPSSSNTFDSLAEAYLRKGDKKSARENYEKALQIDPMNQNSANMLKNLK